MKGQDDSSPRIYVMNGMSIILTLYVSFLGSECGTGLLRYPSRILAAYTGRKCGSVYRGVVVGAGWAKATRTIIIGSQS